MNVGTWRTRWCWRWGWWGECNQLPFCVLPTIWILGLSKDWIFIPLWANWVGRLQTSLREKTHSHPYFVSKIFFSVCLAVTNVDLNYLGTCKIEWAEIFLGYQCQKWCPPILFVPCLHICASTIVIFDKNHNIFYNLV